MSDRVLNDVYLHELYKTAFSELTECFPMNTNIIVEIGAGDGISRKFLQQAILTDIAYHSNLNATCKSHQLPFRSGTIDALVLKDSFHHLPEIELFLNEANRVLRVGARVIVFDPYWGLLARFVYRFLHQEPFDMKTASWRFESTSPWDSNQALSYLLLRRDRERFEREYPFFEIREHKVLIGPSFLISGGVSRRTIISGKFLKLLLNWELRRSERFNFLRFFHIFSLTKTS